MKSGKRIAVLAFLITLVSGIEVLKQVSLDGILFPPRFFNIGSK
jgi:hypothetical protein